MTTTGAASVALLRGWLVGGELPWPSDEAAGFALLGAAEGQGLVGRLHAAIADRDDWPAAVVAEARRRHEALLVRGLRQLDLAARVHRLLGEGGLRSLPLKGAAVAERLYADVGERPMGDVDLLALDDWPASVGALAEAGFEELERADHARSFRDLASGLVVELHHAVTSCPGFFPLDPEALWTRSQTAPGAVPRVPGPEDLLVLLGMHAAFQHGLGIRLGQYLDIRRLLETGVDAVAVAGIAASSRAEGALALALSAAEALVGAPVPARLREALEPRLPASLRPWLAARLGDPLALLTPAPGDLFRVRWGLARGRRLAWLWATVAGREPGPAPSFLARAGATTRRSAHLLRRWALR